MKNASTWFKFDFDQGERKPSQINLSGCCHLLDITDVMFRFRTAHKAGQTESQEDPSFLLASVCESARTVLTDT